jgi:glutathione synthase/RimK-type ligase-like ATP-grasp enzyme
MVTVLANSNDEAAYLVAKHLRCSVNDHNALTAIRFVGSRVKNNALYTINPVDAIENAKHKMRSLEMFRKAKLPVPDFGTDPSKLRFPALGRAFYHYGGTDAKYYKSKRKLDKHDYFIKYMPIDDEYRFHVVLGRIVSVSLKAGGNSDSLIRCHSNGWRHEEVDKTDPIIRTLSPIAKRAVKSLWLHFGAVDIVISGGRPYLLEVNTSPGLIPRRAKLYAKRFSEYLGLAVYCGNPW